MKSLKFVKKQVLVLLVFSLLVAVGSIIHGVYMDLDYKQISRLTVEGILLTFVVLFPAILFLEWVFDVNNRKRIDKIEKRLRRLEGVKRKK
jgi:hypothetical protein